jgi:hypothetical protein
VAGGPFGQGSRHVGRVVGVPDDNLRLAQERFALGRQANTSAVSLEELEPELALEAPNLLAEGWL